MKKTSNNKIFTRRTKRHLAELTLILMSVFLAFILNEVRNNYNENKKLTISLQFIQEEIAENHAFINDAIEIHKDIVQIIDTLLENKTFATTYSERNGFAYEQQKFVMNTILEISDFLQSDVVYDKNRIEINCKMLQKKFNLLIGLELRLLKNYTEAEETILKLID